MPASPSQASQQTGPSRFSGVALHWLRGLVHLARGDERRALESLERELSFESSGHLYARECCANTWYAIGALHARRQQANGGRRGVSAGAGRVSRSIRSRSWGWACCKAGAPMPAAVGRVGAVVRGRRRSGGRSGHGWRSAKTRCAWSIRHLTVAPPGNAGWLLPVEPLLNVGGGTRHRGLRSPAPTRAARHCRSLIATVDRC